MWTKKAMRGALGVLLALVLVLGAGPAPAEPARAPVTYTVSPRLDGERLSGVRIAVGFKANANGVTRLALPSKWMGRDDLWRNIGDLSVEGATSVAEDGPATRVVRSRPGQQLVAHYLLTSTLDHEPTETDAYPSEPWVRPSWFYLDGASALVTIEGRDEAPVRLRWADWPKGFGLASNLEDKGARDPGRGVLIGGSDLRIVRSGVLRLAIRGPSGVPDAVLARELETMLKAERGFFGDRQDQPYLVTASALVVESGAQFHGTGMREAFAMAATPNMSLDDLRILLAHEIFHAWNPARLGQPMGPRSYWLSEGFTDFYARRLLQRERAITPAAFVAAWNTMLREYGVSPARAMPGAQAAEAFWTDPVAGQLPYQRGALLAALWDQRLRRQGSSLDAVLRAQARAFANKPDAGLIDLFTQTMAAHGVDARPDIATYVEQGEPMTLPADLFAPCADLIEITSPVFDLGFTPKVDGQGVIAVANLRQDSAAYRAGLREGMVIVEKLKGVNGDAATPYELRMRSGDSAIRTLSFLPQGAGTTTYQQLVLRPEATMGPRLCDFRP
jgi:predicted metalloprotease with PDZ domain